MALPRALGAVDAGDVEVVGGELEAGQQRLGDAVAGSSTTVGSSSCSAVVTRSTTAASARVRSGAKLGVLNIDAHFDLRADATPSSGTPFRQMADRERQRGEHLHYAVLGISQTSNTRALFDTAAALGVAYLLDDDCRTAARLVHRITTQCAQQ